MKKKSLIPHPRILAGDSHPSPRPQDIARRPRRHLSLRQGLTITREPTPGGYLLRFTGPEARRGGLIDDVLDKVEEWFGRG